MVKISIHCEICKEEIKDYDEVHKIEIGKYESFDEMMTSCSNIMYEDSFGTKDVCKKCADKVDRFVKGMIFDKEVGK